MTVTISVPMRSDVLSATADFFRRLAEIETEMDSAAPVRLPSIDPVVYPAFEAYRAEFVEKIAEKLNVPVEVLAPPAPIMPTVSDECSDDAPTKADLEQIAERCRIQDEAWTGPAAMREVPPAPIMHTAPTEADLEQIAERIEPEPRDATPPPPPPVPATDPDDVDTTDVDSAGEAYDPRIHSSSRGLMKNGTWKLKRGVDPVYVKAVRGGDVPAPAPVIQPPPPPPVPERPQAAVDFAGLMQEAAKRYGSGAIGKLNEIAQTLGLGGFAFLATSPEILAQAWEALTNG